MRKTGRNEPCWCGSGQKYKKCHLNRSTEEAISINRLIAELKSKTFHKECMYPDASNRSCSSKIIDAHTIQKRGPLKSIADESNHVYCFRTDQNGKDVVLKLGWQKASTFKGFCAKHDKAFFSPIEDDLYNGSKSQSFIAGYRAVALEYFKKISAVKGLPFMSQHVDRGMPVKDQVELQRCLNSMKQGFFKGIDDFKETLNTYANSDKSQAYDDFESLSIYFTGDLDIAVSGCFSPDFTISGRRIQTLAPGIKFVENIAVNTLNTKDGYALVFSWPKIFTKCTEFAYSLTSINHSDLPSKLVELIFSYIENTYFSINWFNKLDDNKKTLIESMARRSIQYGEPVKFSNYEYTNWKIDRVVRH
ncbi:YecA family protein [Aeromonas caviae]|uniref:YecA family protein n=1 Tax=Aeromonas caviae TaxID=648 RepID=UPI0038D149E4